MKLHSQFLTGGLIIGLVAGFVATNAPSSKAATLAIERGENPSFILSGEAGARYQLLFTDSLSKSNFWKPLTEITLNGLTGRYLDTGTSSNGQRYYRAKRIDAGSTSDFVFAPQQLAAGEILQLGTFEAGVIHWDTLLVNSSASGILFQNAAPPNGGTYEVSYQFNPLGPLNAQLVLTLPGHGTNRMDQTNTYQLLFTSTNGGAFQADSGPAASSIGQFERDQTLVGSNLMPSQLTAGAVYPMLAPSNGITLVVNSPTSGTLLIEGATGGIYETSLQYSQLGPLSARLQVNILDGGATRTNQTNIYQLLITSLYDGEYQVFMESDMSWLGLFGSDPSLIGLNLASDQLTPGETYRLGSGLIGPFDQDLLVVNSTTSGILMSDGPFGEPDEVALEYRRLGPLSARLQVVSPGGGLFPIDQTNVYQLIFTLTNGGAFQASKPTNQWWIGQFERDQSLMGLNVASSQLTPGESYQLITTGGAITTQETLVVSSTISGILVSDGFTGGMQAVALEYNRLGPLNAQLRVIIPGHGATPEDQIHTYQLVFTSTNGGEFNELLGFPMFQSGQFVRDQAHAGQILAPSQLSAGELYRLYSVSAGFTNQNTLVVNSPSSGLWLPGGPAEGRREASLQYTQLSPISARLQVLLLGDDIFPDQTNSYVLLFTSAIGGVFQNELAPDPPDILQKPFARDLSLVGVAVASSQLSAGETYRLTLDNANNRQDLLVVNSPSTGTLLIDEPPPMGGLFEVICQYRPLGPLSAQLQVILPGDSAARMNQTNTYQLEFTSTNAGIFQADSGPDLSSSGHFERDQSLLGLTVAPSQLNAGETYHLVYPSAGFPSEDTLVVNSPTSGILLSDGPPTGGTYEVAFEYVRLGPLSARVRVIIPDYGPAMGIQTNTYQLLFSAADEGTFTGVSEPGMLRIGQFKRDQSLMGQLVAPLQLSAGESYRLNADAAGIIIQDLLVVNSPTNGILMSGGFMGGIYDVPLEYIRLGPLSARLLVTMPSDGVIMEDYTNTYQLVFTSAFGGEYDENSGPAMSEHGLFERDPSLIGLSPASSQLSAGELYHFVAFDAGITNQQTLVVNSPTSGILVSDGPMGGQYEVSLLYSRLSPFSARLQMIIPDTETPRTDQTNTIYQLIFTATNGGAFQTGTDTFLARTGHFERDQSLVGLNIAPTQLSAGESYRLISVNAGITNQATVVVNSTTSGFLISDGPMGSMDEVGLQYTRLSPFSARLEMIIPAAGAFVMDQTNTYELIFTSTNGGDFQAAWSAPQSQAGHFERDLPLAGREIASAQLMVGESYQLSGRFAWAPHGIVLVTSATTGQFIRAGTAPGMGIIPVNLFYERLGLRSALLTMVFPSNDGPLNPPPVQFLLVYLSAQDGLYQFRTETGDSGIGWFTRSP